MTSADIAQAVLDLIIPGGNTSQHTGKLKLESAADILFQTARYHRKSIIEVSNHFILLAYHYDKEVYCDKKIGKPIYTATLKALGDWLYKGLLTPAESRRAQKLLEPEEAERARHRTSLQRSDSLRSARLNAGKTQASAAQRIGVCRDTISKWENGCCYPTVEQAISLCNYYGKNINDITFIQQKGGM